MREGQKHNTSFIFNTTQACCNTTHGVWLAYSKWNHEPRLVAQKYHWSCSGVVIVLCCKDRILFSVGMGFLIAIITRPNNQQKCDCVLIKYQVGLQFQLDLCRWLAIANLRALKKASRNPAIPQKSKWLIFNLVWGRTYSDDSNEMVQGPWAHVWT